MLAAGKSPPDTKLFHVAMKSTSVVLVFSDPGLQAELCTESQKSCLRVVLWTTVFFSAPLGNPVDMLTFMQIWLHTLASAVTTFLETAASIISARLRRRKCICQCKFSTFLPPFPPACRLLRRKVKVCSFKHQLKNCPIAVVIILC